MEKQIRLLRGRYTTMIQRCHNPKAHAYDRYGGRGIEVCARWRESFRNFVEDMGIPDDGVSLDRIDNDGPYSPQNCRWSTPKCQARNTRENVMIEIDGQSKCLAEWAEDFGLDASVISSRLNLGYSGLDLLKPKNHFRAKTYKKRDLTKPHKPFGRPRKN